MSKSTWMIGSSENCDVVVDEPAVSGQHCRLRLSNGKYTLEDMQSTNGTYVNGNRISKPVPVSPDDTITLGKSTPLPWPSKSASPPLARTVLIGAANDNDIVLTESVVSGYHAKLTLCDNQWTLEDLNSTNGTFLSDPTNRIEKAIVSADDAVFFGSLRVKVSDLIPGTKPVAFAPAQRLSGKEYIEEVRQPSLLGSQYRTMAMCGAAALLLLVLVFGYQMIGSSDAEIGEAGIPQQSDGNGVSDHRDGDGSDVGVVPEAIGNDDMTKAAPVMDEQGKVSIAVADDQTSTRPPIKPKKSNEPIVDPLTASMFQLIVGNNNPRPAEGDEKPAAQNFRVASAWPVRNDLLITSAYAIRSMNDFDEKQLPDRVVLSMAGGETLKIAAVGMHPQYVAARETFLDSVKTYKQIQESTGIGSSGQITETQLPEGVDADQVATQYKTAKLAGEKAYMAMAVTNVGWIRLAKPLANATLVSLIETGTIRPRQTVHMFGAMFSAEDPYYDPAATRGCFRIEASVLKPQLVDVGGPMKLWMLNSKQNWYRLNAEGCVIVDPKSGNRLLGMYSHPTATPETSSQDGRFQIVEAKTIRKMIDAL